MNGFYLMLAMAGGAMMPVQAAMNARLAQGVGGTTWATALSALGVAVVLSVAGLIAGHGRWAGATWQAPWWAWGGGFCGAIVLFAAAAATPRIGAMTMVALMVAGQALASAALDARGWFGLTAQPPTAARIVAALLIVAGAIILALSSSPARSN
ncbi:transporter family-2 protein [Chelatococcus caeni]|uniref:Transporter family-2 protein n=1 Tax=Chelatococcus caeni TaxID=1348468 RepID=A0A840C1T6_9HYPH|nr:DMT family transporter [Chelatococcus caeni]MBB4017459.1 transporter family-2 protein [Chelatococcus caeni]